MPFVIDWGNIAAMGSLAAQAGQAQGTAQGRNILAQRQDAVDARDAEINQRNQELSLQAIEGPRRQQQAFDLSQQAANNQLARQLTLNRSTGDYGLERAQIIADAAAQRAVGGQQAIAQRQQDNIVLEKQQGVEADQQKREQLRQDVIQQHVSLGHTQEEATRLADELMLSRERRGKAPQQPGRGDYGMKVSGDLPTAGYSIAARRAWKELAQAVRDPRKPRTAPTLVMGGIAQYIDNAADDEVVSIIQDPSAPPEVKALAQQEYTQRGKFGSNQPGARSAPPPAASQGRGVQDMSDDELNSLFN